MKWSLITSSQFRQEGGFKGGAAMDHPHHEASPSVVIASIKYHSETAISLENGLQIPAMLKQAVDQK